MDSLLKFSNQSIIWLLPLLLAVSVGLVIAIIIQGRQFKKFRLTWKQLLEGTNGENLERLLHDQLRQSIALETQLEAARERLDGLEIKIKSSKRYVGLVRYDAFADIGGSQSFSLALYDEDGNGAVVTSQVGREVCRVYGKQLYQGRSEFTLTVEEQKAIELAASNKIRARISP